jgi:hypothetical protein
VPSSSSQGNGLRATTVLAQTFLAKRTGRLSSIGVNVDRNSRYGLPDKLTLQLRTVEGGEPSDVVLTERSLNVTDVARSVGFGTPDLTYFDLSRSDVTLVGGTSYAIVLLAPGLPTSVSYTVYARSGSLYDDGAAQQSSDAGATWFTFSTLDFIFDARVHDSGGDFDDDGVPDDGDDSDCDGDAPCADGQTIGCDDNCPLIPNPDQADCDGDGVGDACALASGLAVDCNANGVPDECDSVEGGDLDSDGAVTLADWAGWGRCASGPDGVIPDYNGDPACSAICGGAFDTDGDGDIDLLDAAHFQESLELQMP